MSPLLSGLVSGLIFGAIDVGLMLPMSFPDKKTALLGAFFSRFAIGLVIPLIQLPSWPGWLIGVTFRSAPYIGGLTRGWKVSFDALRCRCPLVGIVLLGVSL